VYWIGAAMGIWLFYVQHQFEGVYWDRPPEWNHISASLDGSSFYKLPKVIQWFTGNIGYHHIHHLSSMIPNYNLEKCHRELIKLRPVHQVGFIPSLKALSYRLWDEGEQRMISFRQYKAMVSSSASLSSAESLQ
jgi:omega-6 fatty acid desaturase (delta-12 desaturase)